MVTLWSITIPVTIAMLGACGTSRAQVKEARDSGYDTDFAIVYGAALDVVRKAYPRHFEDASAGIIKTMWHPVRIATDASSPDQVSQPLDTTMGNPMQQTTVSHNRKLFFIRFRVHVVGGHPWRVAIRGEASEWQAGGVPAPLRGAEVPHWLAGRTNALRVKIHKRLRKHAVKLISTAKVEKQRDEPVVEVDQSYLGDLEPSALSVVVTALSAAKARDYDALRTTMRPAFTWNLGAQPDRDMALGMWQADSSVLAKLVAVIEAGCKTDASKDRIRCPAAFAERPDYTGYRVDFERGPDGAWKMTRFVDGD